MQVLPFHKKLIVIATVLAAGQAFSSEGQKFDVQALEGLGFGAEVSEYFSKDARFLPGTAFVSISVNTANVYNVEVTFNNEGQLCFDDVLLNRLKLKTNKVMNDECTNLTDLWPTGVIKVYPNNYRVELTLPESAFDPAQKSGSVETGGYAFLLNYDLYTQRISNQSEDFNFVQGRIEPGFNIDNWIVRHRANFSKGFNDSRFQTDEVYVARAIEPIESVVKAGQFRSQGQAFSSLPIQGIELASDRDYNDMTQLVIPIEGIANTNATIEIKQRGRLVYRTLVPAGPFSLRHVPGFSNGLPADVTVLEEDGRQHQFSVASAMGFEPTQEKSRYQVAIGRYYNPVRLNNTEDDSRYAPVLGMGEVEFNSHKDLRHTFAVLLSSDYQNIAFRSRYAGLKGYWLNGGISVANGKPNQHQIYSGSKPGKQQGIQVDAQGQAQISSSLTGSLSAQYRDRDYFNPDEAFDSYSTFDDGKLRYTTSMALNWVPGSWGAFAYTATRNDYYGEGGHDFSHTLSSNHRIGPASLNFNFNKQSGVKSIYANLSFPLGRGTFQSRAQRVDDTLTLGTSYYSRLGANSHYSIEATKTEEHKRYSGSIGLNTSLAKLSATASASNQSSHSYAAMMSGSLMYANGYFATSSEQVGDTFAIVSVPKQSGVKITAPGSAGTLTNYFGTAVLPKLPPYQPSQARLDTTSVPLNVRLGSSTTDLYLARGTVASRLIPAKETRQILLKIRNTEGVPLSLGNSVMTMDGDFLGTIVGDGNAMVSNGSIGKPLRVRINPTQECVVEYQAPDKFDPNEPYAEVDAVCR